MREFIVILITLILTRIISTGIYSLINHDYNWLKDDFNLWLFVIDFGIFIVIYIAIYSFLKKIFIKNEQ